MKRHIIFISISLIIISLTLYTCSQKQSPKGETSETCFRAAEGDTMWVLLNHIKADKCEQFEKFVHEILRPIVLKSEPINQQAINYFRSLHPVKMNKDSTYTYVFLMDPVFKNANYQVSYYLKKEYDEAKTKEYLKMFNECYASPQTGYTLIQSQH